MKHLKMDTQELAERKVNCQSTQQELELVSSYMENSYGQNLQRATN